MAKKIKVRCSKCKHEAEVSKTSYKLALKDYYSGTRGTIIATITCLLCGAMVLCLALIPFFNSWMGKIIKIIMICIGASIIAVGVICLIIYIIRMACRRKSYDCPKCGESMLPC